MTASDPRLDALLDWIRATTQGVRPRVLVPVSGGSDSALCFWLCVRALGDEHVVAAFIGRELRCQEWFDALGTVQQFSEPGDSTDPEIARWGILLREAKRVHGWLAGSRNRTEEVLGTYSLATRMATYLPLVGLWKSEVMELARLVGVPDAILQSSRDADPACGRPAEMAAIPFADVDRFLQARIGERPTAELAQISPEHVAYLEEIYRHNRFKADLPCRPPRRQAGQPIAVG